MPKLSLGSKIIVIFIINILILISFQSSVSANDYISNPSNIPKFEFEQNGELKQGSKAGFILSITNRYESKITNVYLTINFYEYVTSEGSIPFSEINYIPLFVESNSPEISFDWYEQAPSVTNTVFFNVSAYDLTPPGTYFMRSVMVFDYNGTIYTMKSRGYFTDELWKQAEKTATPDDPAGINLETLGVDGIIPDTGFDVVEYKQKEEENYDWIIWPAVIILIIAVGIGYFYYRKREKDED
jgi:hypothetical protein